MRNPPPSMRAAIEILEARGHSIVWRVDRAGSIRYRVDAGREMNALAVMRRFLKEKPCAPIN